MTERTSVGLQRNIIANKTNKIEIANNNIQLLYRKTWKCGNNWPIKLFLFF